MIGYATVGTNDIDRARTFYDSLLGELGARRILEFPENGFTMYGVSFGKPALAVTKPYDGGEARPGLRGPEGDQAFYGAYFRDLDGNKFCVFRVGPAS